MSTNFKYIQDTLLEEIQKTRQQKQASLTEENTKLQLSDAFFCWEDILKNRKFYQALCFAIRDIKNKFPTEKIQILDAGSGTWILGILALLAWADYVTFIEANSHTLAWSKEFITKLWYAEKCSFYCEDATNIQLSHKYHLLISETITIDFQREDFHNIIAHLKQFLLPQAYIIPESFDITFSQQDSQKNIISKNTISRKSLWDFSSHREVFLEAAKKLEISGNANLYENIFIHSWDCVSFFNTMSFERDELWDEFVWGKQKTLTKM